MANIETLIDAWVSTNMHGRDAEPQATSNIVTTRIQNHFSNSVITNLNVRVENDINWRVSFTIDDQDFEFQSPNYEFEI